MKKLVVSVLALVATVSAKADSVTPALKHALFGYAACESVPNKEHFQGTIFLHEDFLQKEAYAIFSGEVLEQGKKLRMSVFLTTNPDMDDKHFILHFSREGKKLGTLNIRNKGLEGQLQVDQITLQCSPILPVN